MPTSAVSHSNLPSQIKQNETSKNSNENVMASPPSPVVMDAKNSKYEQNTIWQKVLKG